MVSKVDLGGFQTLYDTSLGIMRPQRSPGVINVALRFQAHIAGRHYCGPYVFDVVAVERTVSRGGPGSPRNCSRNKRRQVDIGVDLVWFIGCIGLIVTDVTR